MGRGGKTEGVADKIESSKDVQVLIPRPVNKLLYTTRGALEDVIRGSGRQDTEIIRVGPI